MSRNGRFTYICKILLFAILLITLLYVVIEEYGMKAEKFALYLSDESDRGKHGSKEETEAEQSQEIMDEGKETDSTIIRVLLYGNEYTSIYHDMLSLETENGALELTAALLTQQFELLQSRCNENGYQLEKTEDRYQLCPQEENVIRQKSIVRSMGYPEYRGNFWLYIVNDKLVIINELTLREYLYGVLPSEMPASYEAEALKAQAVCARTFAYRYMETPRYPEYQAALDDSTTCQVYRNLPEQQETNQAVDDTDGVLLLYDGKPAITFYYSTSCGLSADVTVWQEYEKEEYPYLTAAAQNEIHAEVDFRDDPDGKKLLAYLEQTHGDYEENLPWYRWNCTIEHMDPNLLYQRMSERYAVKPETILTWDQDRWISKEPEPMSIISRMAVAERNPGGNVTAVEVEGPEGRYLIMGEYNIRYLLCDGKTRVTRQDGSVQEMGTLLPSGFFVLQPILYNEENIGYSIVGGGYGHGVGMSQNGANEMAKKGMDYETILRYYYLETEVMK